MKYRNAILIVLLVIIADQALKIFIKTHFCNGDGLKMAGTWFSLHFIENEGMAYGMKLSDSATGKLILSTFRLIAVIFGFFLLHRIVRKGYTKGAIICGALILAGALGNLIDSMFYGLIFTDSPYTCFSSTYDTLGAMAQNQGHTSLAHFTQWGHGYGKFLQGKVVDMLYFPIIKSGKDPNRVYFFEPVFNIADAAISVGVITFLLFQKRFIVKSTDGAKTLATE